MGNTFVVNFLDADRLARRDSRCAELRERDCRQAEAEEQFR
jgi:hypothetical protein